jgi:MerR family copper efflux transcriptional regulator
MSFTIGEAAKASGMSAKMIRYYEDIGLLPRAPRSEGNYRHYDARSVHALRFIRRARDLGFPVPAIARLMALWQDRSRASAEVKALAEEHIGGLQAKIAEMAAMVRTLEHLAAHCQGDDRPDCPILDDLAAGESALGDRALQPGQQPAEGQAACRHEDHERRP